MSPLTSEQCAEFKEPGDWSMSPYTACATCGVMRRDHQKAPLASNEQNPMPPLARVLVRASTFRLFGRLANAEQKFVVVLADEVQRLTRELEIQKAVVELAYIPHRSLVESRDRADAEIARLRPMAESWESYEAAQERKAEMRLAAETGTPPSDEAEKP